MKKLKNIFFDLDGTLLDSVVDIANAVNHTLEHFSLDRVENEYIASSVGNGASKLIDRVLTKFDTNSHKKEYVLKIRDTLFKYYLEYYHKNCVVDGRLYEGVTHGLDKLSHFGFNMFVITNKPNDVAIETVKRLSIEKYFKAIIGDGWCEARKPDVFVWNKIVQEYPVSKADSILVGDGVADYQFAQNACIDVLLVLYGITKREILQELNAKHYFETFNDVVEYICTTQK